MMMRVLSSRPSSSARGRDFSCSRGQLGTERGLGAGTARGCHSPVWAGAHPHTYCQSKESVSAALSLAQGGPPADVFMLLSCRSRGVMKVPVTAVGTGVTLVPATAVGTGVTLVPATAVGTGVTLVPTSRRSVGRGRLCRRDSSRDEALRLFSSHTSGNTQDTAPGAASGEGTGVAVASDLPASVGGSPGEPCSGGAGAGDSAPSGVPWQGRGPAPPSPAGGSGLTGLQERSAGAARHP